MKYQWKDVERLSMKIVKEIVRSGWTPDYVVGVGRNGAVPAMLIGNWFGVYTQFCNLSLKEGKAELPCYVSEDAAEGKNILVVDDFVNTGTTIEYLKNDWTCPVKPIKWSENVRVAVLIFNESNEKKVDVDYTADSDCDFCYDPPQWPWQSI